MKKSICSFLCLVLAILPLHAQNEKSPKTPFTKMYFNVWKEAARHCTEVAVAMPENLYSFKPTPESKTFAQQIVHIGASVKLLTQRYVEGKNMQPSEPNAQSMSKKDIINFLQESFDYTSKVIKTINQEQLDELCEMYHSKNTVSRAFALFYVQDHMANHRAKANLYIRMNNIKPPEYTW